MILVGRVTCILFCVTENNDWTVPPQTWFIQHKHNKPFVASPVMIYKSQNPSGIHYVGCHFGFFLFVFFHAHITERLLALGDNKKQTVIHLLFCLQVRNSDSWAVEKYCCWQRCLNVEMFTSDLQDVDQTENTQLHISQRLLFMSMAAWITALLKVVQCSNQNTTTNQHLLIRHQLIGLMVSRI